MTQSPKPRDGITAAFGRQKIRKVQTEIVFDDYWLEHAAAEMIEQGKPARLVALYLDRDAITGRLELTVFADDGRGNGNLLFKAELE